MTKQQIDNLIKVKGGIKGQTYYDSDNNIIYIGTSNGNLSISPFQLDKSQSLTTTLSKNYIPYLGANTTINLNTQNLLNVGKISIGGLSTTSYVNILGTIQIQSSLTTGDGFTTDGTGTTIMGTTRTRPSASTAATCRRRSSTT